MNTLQSLVVKRATKDREGDGRRQLPIAGGAPAQGLQREGGLSRLWGDDCFCPSLAFSPFSLLEVAYQLGGVSLRVSKPTDY